jgi:hypothetical protein
LHIKSKMINYSSKFKRITLKNTGRQAIQLTNSEGTCYPLYYYITSFSSDHKNLIYHEAKNNQVQMHCLDLNSGSSTQLTYADHDHSRWVPWCCDSGKGVLDHRSVLDTKRDQLIYFNGNDVHRVDLDGEEDEILFTLPKDRIAIAQNCMSSCGDWFVYIHHDKENFNQVYKNNNFNDSERALSRGTVLTAYNLETKEHRNLVIINSPIHHVLPLNDNKFVFCHPTKENGMLLTDIKGGWYTHMRTQDDQGGCVCHYLANEDTIQYEILGRNDEMVLGGKYNPRNHERYEFELPPEFGYTHTGWDPKGKMWFYENSSKTEHSLKFLCEHHADKKDEWIELTGDWPTFGTGQKSHFHPQLTPDRKHILITAGDPDTKSNQLFLIDISELEDTKGIPNV